MNSAVEELVQFLQLALLQRIEMLANGSEKGRGVQWFNQIPRRTATITRRRMRPRRIHSRRLCRLSRCLKARIKLANGAGTLLARRPMIALAAHRNQRLFARRAFAVVRFRITLLVGLAKFTPDIVLTLPLNTRIGNESRICLV
jgi:hypothetical protein